MRATRFVVLPVVLSATLLVIDSAQAQPLERSGEQVVKAQCIKCHETGAYGAPKIDDRAAWAPRMKNGLDATVRSAIRGRDSLHVLRRRAALKR
jgi:cytochrome c5